MSTVFDSAPPSPGEGCTMAIPCPICADLTGNCWYTPDRMVAWCITPDRAGDLYDPDQSTIWWPHALCGEPCLCGAEHAGPLEDRPLFPPGTIKPLPPVPSPLLGEEARPCPICGAPAGCRFTSDGQAVVCASEPHAGFQQESSLLADHWAHALHVGCGCGIDHRLPGEEPPSRDAPRPIRQPGIKELEATIAAQQAELAAAHDRIATLEAIITGLQAQRDRFELEEPAAIVADLTRKLAHERSARRELVDVLGRRDMTPLQRVVTAAAKHEADAYRRPPAFGAEVAQPEPRHVTIGALAAAIGVSARAMAPALKKAHNLGLITRTEENVAAPRPNGSVAVRKEVYLAPGRAHPEPIAIDLLRERRRTQSEADRQARKDREAQHRANLAELAAAKVRAEQDGCTDCGGTLLPTGYFCADCGAEHSTKALAAVAPPKSADPNRASSAAGAHLGESNPDGRAWVADAEAIIDDNAAFASNDLPAVPHSLPPGIRRIEDGRARMPKICAREESDGAAGVTAAPEARPDPPVDRWMSYGDPAAF